MNKEMLREKADVAIRVETFCPIFQFLDWTTNFRQLTYLVMSPCFSFISEGDNYLKMRSACNAIPPFSYWVSHVVAVDLLLFILYQVVDLILLQGYLFCQ